MKSQKLYKEKGAKYLFFISAAFSAVAVIGIVIYLFAESLPAFKEIGIFNFLFGKLWLPDNDLVANSDKFGILPMIVSSLCVTGGAILIGGVIGVLLATFAVKFCPSKFKGAFTQIINLLSGIPSIIYGFVGLQVLVPIMAKISPNGTGYGILTSSIVLGIMILPTVTGIAKDALEALPTHYYDSAIALGATKAQAVYRVMLPAGKSGVVTGLVLGIGRAIGETMAVLMVCGNSPLFPKGLFGNIRPLTTNVVTEMGYATGLHKQSLIATGFVLLIFILIINLSLNLLKRDKKGIKLRKHKLIARANNISVPVNYKKTGYFASTLKYISCALAVLVIATLAFIIIYILGKGLPHLSLNFLFGKSTNGNPTLLPAFASTGLIILTTLLITLPLGIGAAIYLVEYAKKGSRIVKVIRLFTETLAGIPSIVFGLFGMIFFSEILGLGYSLLAGSFTMVLMTLPTIIRSTEESLLAVSNEQREASLALGAGKLRTIFKVVLPSALSGVATAVILSIGRIVGESAALIYTAGSSILMPRGLLDMGATFAVLIWKFSTEGRAGGIENAFATASVLIIIVALLNLLVFLIKRKTTSPKTKNKVKSSIKAVEVHNKEENSKVC